MSFGSWRATAKTVQCNPSRKIVFLTRMPYLCRKPKNKGNMSKYTYKPQYGVIVICQSEEEQKAVFERLKQEGLTLKVVNV